MALIRFSNLVNDIRGSSGGNTFSRGLAGATVSMKRTVSVPEGRSFRSKGFGVSEWAKLWRSLSESNRGSWSALARESHSSNRLGLSRSATGLELFTSLNSSRKLLGLSFLESPVLAASIFHKPVNAIQVFKTSPSTFNIARVLFTGTNPPATYIVRMSKQSFSTSSAAQSAPVIFVQGFVNQGGISPAFTSSLVQLVSPFSFRVGEYYKTVLQFADPSSGYLASPEVFISQVM